MSLLDLIGALLTAVAVLGYVNHRLVRLPDTIGITAMGLLVSLLLVLAAVPLRAPPTGPAGWPAASISPNWCCTAC